MKPYYTHDSITIYHGDCREVLPTLGRVDHVITDPPYSEQTHKGARTARDGSKKLVDFESTTADEIRATIEGIDLARWLVSFMDWKHIARLEQRPPRNLEFIRMGVWIKPNGSPQFTGDRPAQGWEGVAILHPSGKKKWNGGGFPAVWTFNKENTQHPTGKPLTLVSKLVAQFTDPNDLILDPFMGSGTTLRAAKDLGRRAIGIEIEEKYCEIAARRLAQEVLC